LLFEEDKMRKPPMNAYICTIIFLAFALACLPLGIATADVLPYQVPENQVFSKTSIIEGVGALAESHSVVWQIGDGGFAELPDGRVSSARDAIRSGSIAYVTYKDSITTNGGQISEVKSFSMDTHAKTAGMFNIETTKVLTYTSQNGSHLMGEESYVLDVAGNWSYGPGGIVCVFARGNNSTIPAFCNKVTASSKLTSVTTAQVETIGRLTAVGKDTNVPATLKYEISVTPDANSASGYADGIVSTTFTVSVMEGQSSDVLWPAVEAHPGVGPGTYIVLNSEDFPWDELAATLTYIDTATAVGGISTFNKIFDYQSGISCVNC